MQYVNLGNSGLKVSRICLGMMSYGTSRWRDWILNEEEGRPFIQKAYESGINFYDTANMYSRGVSEEVTGKLIKEVATHREEVVIATKIFFNMGDGKPNRGGLSRKHIMASIDASLKRLDTDYVDILQTHRWDNETPIEETMEALHDVVKAGKARYIGASSMWTWQFAKAQYLADLNGWTRFLTMQNHYNLIYREEEREMIPFCQDQGIGIIPWSPLARGFLAGNRSRQKDEGTSRAKTDDFAHLMYYRDIDFDIVDRLKAVAERLDKKPAQVALAWMLHKPAIHSPIIGATKMYQLEEAIDAVDIELTEDDMMSLEELYQPKPILGHD